MMQQLSHENVVRLQLVLDERGDCVAPLVMDFMPHAAPLQARISQQRGFPPLLLKILMWQLLKALRFLRRRHRPPRPEARQRALRPAHPQAAALRLRRSKASSRASRTSLHLRALLPARPSSSSAPPSTRSPSTCGRSDASSPRCYWAFLVRQRGVDVPAAARVPRAILAQLCAISAQFGATSTLRIHHPPLVLKVIGSPTDGDLKAMRVDYRTSDLPTLRPYPWTRLFEGPRATPSRSSASSCVRPAAPAQRRRRRRPPLFQPAPLHSLCFRPPRRPMPTAPATRRRRGRRCGGGGAAAARRSRSSCSTRVDDALSALRRLAAHPDDGGGAARQAAERRAPEWHEGFDERLSERLRAEGAEFSRGGGRGSGGGRGAGQLGGGVRASRRGGRRGRRRARRAARARDVGPREAGGERGGAPRARRSRRCAPGDSTAREAAEVPAAEGAGAAAGRADAGRRPRTRRRRGRRHRRRRAARRRACCAARSAATTGCTTRRRARCATAPPPGAVRLRAGAARAPAYRRPPTRE